MSSPTPPERRRLYRGAPESYHHSQTSRFTPAECAAAVGKRAAFVVTGTIVEARKLPAGTAVLLEADERFGFEKKFGGDLELFEILEDE